MSQVRRADMSLFDAFAWVVGSPVFQAAMVMAAAGGIAFALRQAVRARQRLQAFVREHGLRWSEPESTMWLARVVERLEAWGIEGEIAGLRVGVQRRRRGVQISVTADTDLVSTARARHVSLGAWTRPEPPALLRGLPLEASGRELRLHLGAGDFAPYLLAAVAYARTLSAQPVVLDAGGQEPAGSDRW